VAEQARPTPAVNSVPELIDELRRLENSLSAGNGVKWFVRLYHEVTEAIALELNAGDLEDPVFLELLVLVYGNSVLNVCEDAEQRSSRIARAWAPLFERRHDPRVAPLQFALAGLNAHTNHDVPIGLVHACRSTGIAPRSDSPQYRDYMKMSALMRRSSDQVKDWLLSGALGDVDTAFGDLDDVVAIFSLQRARQAAWTNGEVLWELRENEPLTVAYVGMLDRMAGFGGRGLLLPTAL
jgi:Family of unknown function (DUF5995)